MESKTVVYTPDAGSGSGSGMMAMLAPLLQQKGIDPNLLMALNSKGNGNGFGGDGSWFLWIIFLFFLFPGFNFIIFLLPPSTVAYTSLST